MESSPPSPERILQTGLGFWASKTLLSAVELGLFTELAKEPGDCHSLVDRLGLNGRGALDFLDALVALGFLKRDEAGIYTNTTETDLFLDRANPAYVGGILEMANHRLYPFWGSLTEALQTGEPQNEAAQGEDLFDRLYEDPDRLKEFLSAMSGVSHGANVAIASQFDWSGYQSFVDAGTAQGDLAVQIALTNSHLKGVGFDLPPVGPIFEEHASEAGVADRLHFVGGSFFDDPLPKTDVVLYGHILHDWNLQEKRQLLRTAWEALPEGGSVIVYESIIDDDRAENAFGLLMSLNMLIETKGGFDYTGADCRGWMEEVGFRETRVEHLVGPDSMVIGVK